MFYETVQPISMIPEYKERIAFRLSTEGRQQIDKLVSEGKFESLSHVIRVALSEFLDKNA